MNSFSHFEVNPEQQEAIGYNNGPLLIIAGAGTGKTRVIVEKITYLIEKNLAKPEQILALTFTEKAASEMEERVDQAVPYGYFQMSISTFHAFADQIVKEHISHIGLNPSYRLMTEAEAILFLRQNLFLFNLKYFQPLANPHKFLGAMLNHFSRLKDEDISPDEYLQWAKKNASILKNDKEHKEEKTFEAEKYLELAQAYKTYQQLKVKEGRFDFSDLLYYALELFRKRKNILSDYQKKFTHVLVDEFQDTNIAQYALIKLLCPEKQHPKLTIVGDDSQAIYKFRGASVSNILAFMKDYPRTHQVTLRKNYRSNQTILDSAYKMIRHNDPDTLESKLGISKNLLSQKKDDKQAVTLSVFSHAEEEAEYVAQTILKLRSGYRFSDFAILTRAHNHADPFVRALIRKGIPYQFLGPGILLKQPEVKDLIAYLKVLYNPDDTVSLYRVLIMDLFSPDMEDVVSMLSFAKKTNQPLFQTIKIYFSLINKDLYKTEYGIYKPYLPLLGEKTKQILFNVYNMVLRHLSLSKKETAGQILFYFLEDTNYLSKLVSYKSEKDEKIANNISRFFTKLKNYESDHEDASVRSVVEYLDMSIELGESPLLAQEDASQSNAVNLLSVHAAKGLEFGIVFLANLTRGRFPTYERREPIPVPDELIKEILPLGDYHLEEERRLFYVGMTRAKDRLYLMLSKFYGEGKREQKISPFVIEAIGKENIPQEETAKTKQLQLAMFAFDKPKTIYDTNQLPVKSSLFSYTQLETYDRCPLQYRYQYVLRIPTTASGAASFGTSIHKTLHQFYKEYITDPSVDINRLYALYENSWIPVGYSSHDNEVKTKNEGKKMLEKYFNSYHSRQIKTLELEKLFKIKINKDLCLTGKIDRIDQKNDNGIEIIDYKTGKIPDHKEFAKNIQLSIYALAAHDKGLYNKPLNKISLSFHYLQTSEKITISRTLDDIQKVKDKVISTAENIHQARFEPNVGPWCGYCPYRIICEAW